MVGAPCKDDLSYQGLLFIREESHAGVRLFPQPHRSSRINLHTSIANALGEDHAHGRTISIEACWLQVCTTREIRGNCLRGNFFGFHLSKDWQQTIEVGDVTTMAAFVRLAVEHGISCQLFEENSLSSLQRVRQLDTC